MNTERLDASLPTIARRRTPAGAAPGTLIPDRHAVSPQVSVMAYSRDNFHAAPVEDVDSLRDLVGNYAVIWIDVQGLRDVTVIEQLGEIFELHDLALEDVVNVHQRPKVEPFDDHLFIVSRMPLTATGVQTEQLALFLGRNFVLTFQERPGDQFGPVRERIRRSSSRIREAGADYLAYALLDAIIDAYFPVLEEYGEKVEALESDVIDQPGSTDIGRIHEVKRDLLSLRRTLWPLRETANALVRDDTPFVMDRTRTYLRDSYDHTVQLMDALETYREVASGLIDVHLSMLSTRMNEIMKLLTVIATIFIPLGFVASLYGMNFDASRSPWNMPELRWYFGYPFALSVMLVVGIGLLIYFRFRGWLGGARDREARRRSRRGPTP